MTRTTTPDVDAHRALRLRHRATWALGDYPTLAHHLIAPLGPRRARRRTGTSGIDWDGLRMATRPVG